MKSDPSEVETKVSQALREFAAAETEYRSHGLWKRLGCTPEALFLGVERHLAALPIAPLEWGRLYRQLQAEVAERCREPRTLRRTGFPSGIKI